MLSIYFDGSYGPSVQSSNRFGLFHQSLQRWRRAGRHKPSNTESAPFHTGSESMRISICSEASRRWKGCVQTPRAENRLKFLVTEDPTWRATQQVKKKSNTKNMKKKISKNQGLWIVVSQKPVITQLRPQKVVKYSSRNFRVKTQQGGSQQQGPSAVRFFQRALIVLPITGRLFKRIG